MTDDHLKNYLILGIQPGTGWRQLRQAYKKLVNAWHPDRFQQDPRQKKLAEEKTKEITQSYKKLAEYYKKFGVLPLPAEEKSPPAADERVTASTATGEPPPIVVVPKPVTATTPAQVPAGWISQPRILTIVAAGIFGLAYLTWQAVPREKLPSGDGRNTKISHEVQRNGSADTPAAEKRFTTGASMGDVYAIQGVPSKTENGIWYYGNSRIYFVKGKVTHWEEYVDNPLRVEIAPDKEKIKARLFGKGSSKQEVLEVQGTPDRDSGSVWDYGVSRVYFEKDRVSGWHEAQYNPLRVRN